MPDGFAPRAQDAGLADGSDVGIKALSGAVIDPFLHESRNREVRRRANMASKHGRQRWRQGRRSASRGRMKVGD